MQYKGFIIRKTHYNQYEIKLPQSLGEQLPEGWPFPSTVGVKDTKEEAMKFADKQIEQAETMLEQIKEVKQLTKGFPK